MSTTCLPTRMEARDPAIRIEGVVKRFGPRLALNGLDMTVPRGSVYLLAGRNGAGKTTALQIVLGLETPSGGALDVLSMDPRVDGHSVRAPIAHLLGVCSPGDSMQARLRRHRRPELFFYCLLSFGSGSLERRTLLPQRFPENVLISTIAFWISHHRQILPPTEAGCK